MSSRTRFLSRLIGLYCIFASLSMATHKQASLEMARALIQNPPVLFVCGLIAVVTGLAMILGHNVWSGGALPVIVTLIGWSSLLKGLLILFLWPEAAYRFFLVGLHYEQFFYLYAAISLILGIYLTFGGSRSTAVK